MNIGYISYEYPPDTAVGGIATYVYQVSQMMQRRGHLVEVFCASSERTTSEYYNEIFVHRVKCLDNNRFHFSKAILTVFTERHSIVQFDIIESPEYSADALSVKLHYRQLPLVVKLHTPHYLIRQLSCYYDNWHVKLRFILGGIKRGKIVRPYWLYLKTQDDPDYQITKLANQIHTPSISLGDKVSNKWKIKPDCIYHVPYPYIPEEALLKIPPGTSNNTVMFVGRLEVRKGVVEFCKAIPLVLKQNASIKFRFCGPVAASPLPDINMKIYIERQLHRFKNNIEFLEVPFNQISSIYETADICVFPSIWENFPNVCLEAMSAARGIVASKEGGMKDMLGNPKAGILVDPLRPQEIAGAILYLINNPAKRKKLGQAARDKVCTTYNQEVIGRKMEKYYLQAINDKHESGHYKLVNE